MVCSEHLITDPVGRPVLWYVQSILTTDLTGRPVLWYARSILNLIVHFDLFCGMFRAF